MKSLTLILIAFLSYTDTRAEVAATGQTTSQVAGNQGSSGTVPLMDPSGQVDTTTESNQATAGAAISKTPSNPESPANILSVQSTNQPKENEKVKAADGKEIVTIYATGFGSDVPSAAQNAAKNALTQAVGSFIDATEALNKKVNIENGISEISKSIKTDIKEYSQGSIAGFETLNISNNGGMVNLSAKVDVKIDDFRHYVEAMAKDEIAIHGASLFAEAAENKRQADDKLGILYEKVLRPVVTGRAETISISKPVSAKNMIDKIILNPGTIRRYPSNDIAKQELTSRLGIGSLSPDLFAFDVELDLDNNYLANAHRVLNEIASSKHTFRGCGDPSHKHQGEFSQLLNKARSNDGFIISILGGSRKSCDSTELDVYLIEGVGTNLAKLIKSSEIKIVLNKLSVGRELVLTFKDNNGVELSSNLANKKITGGGDGFNLWFADAPTYLVSRSFIENIYFEIHDNMLERTMAWTLADMNLSYNILTIVPVRKFHVFSKVDMESLSKATSVEAKFN